MRAEYSTDFWKPEGCLGLLRSPKRWPGIVVPIGSVHSTRGETKIYESIM